MTQEVWVHFTEEQLQQYYGALDKPEAAAGILADVLKLPNYRFDAREAIRLDYAAYALQFAKNQAKFGPIRTASLFNVAQQLLENCIAGVSFDDCQATFKTALLNLCSHKPGLDSGQFSPDSIAQIGNFFAKTFFRHFKLYAYVFSNEQAHTEYTTGLLVEIPSIQPFEEALSQEDWDAFHEKKRAEEEAAAKVAAEEEARAAAEAERLREEQERAEEEARRQAELARKPATLEEAIEVLVAQRLESEKDALASAYKAKEAELLAKIATLEQHAVTAKPGGKK